MIGILPTLPRATSASTASRPTRATGCSASRSWPPAARTSRSSIAGPERLATTADSIVPEAACTSIQIHVQTSPEQFADYWNASQAIAGDPARARRQLALPARQGAVARDPDPAVRAGHRHPQRGAEGAGRPAAGVVRRAVDQLGLRPVRGERPLLPGAAPDHRGRGPARGARGRGRPAAVRAAAPQRHDLPLEPAGLRHRRRGAPPAGREPLPGRRADGRRHDGQRGVLLRPGPRTSPRASGRCGRRCRSPPRRRTSTSRPSTASTAQVYWPGVGQVPRRPSWCCASCCRWPDRARSVGRPRRGERPLPRDHRAALPRRRQRRGVVRPPDARALRPRPLRRAADARSRTTASTCTPTSRSTPGS